MSKRRSRIVNVRQLFDGSHWSFLCFDPERWKLLTAMLADLFGKGARRLSIRKAHFPAGVLWNRRECHTLFVPKAKLGREELGRGLREYLGYEALASEFDVFTLGVTPAEDAELDQVGPFGRKR